MRFVGCVCGGCRCRAANKKKNTKTRKKWPQFLFQPHCVPCPHCTGAHCTFIIKLKALKTASHNFWILHALVGDRMIHFAKPHQQNRTIGTVFFFSSEKARSIDDEPTEETNTHTHIRVQKQERANVPPGLGVSLSIYRKNYCKLEQSVFSYINACAQTKRRRFRSLALFLFRRGVTISTLRICRMLNAKRSVRDSRCTTHVLPMARGCQLNFAIRVHTLTHSSLTRHRRLSHLLLVIFQFSFSAFSIWLPCTAPRKQSQTIQFSLVNISINAKQRGAKKRRLPASLRPLQTRVFAVATKNNAKTHDCGQQLLFFVSFGVFFAPIAHECIDYANSSGKQATIIATVRAQRTLQSLNGKSAPFVFICIIMRVQIKCVPPRRLRARKIIRFWGFRFPLNTIINYRKTKWTLSHQMQYN